MSPQELFAAAWSGFLDILQFQIFITPSLLLATYYFGAVLIPVLLFIAFRRASRAVDQHGVNRQTLSGLVLFVTDRPLRLVFLAVVMFIAAQLMWRMIFEFMLAYFQIRDALVAQ